MSEPTITCPKCKTEIKLTESIAAPLVAATRVKYEKQLSDQEQSIEIRLSTARTQIATEEITKARTLVATDLRQTQQQLSELQTVLTDREAKLASAQKAQADVLRMERELNDARRELDLTIEQRVTQQLTSVRDKAKTEAEEALKLRLAERDDVISSMTRQIDDLKKKAEQGSQQTQGEAQETELETALRSKFPYDLIDPVPKGEFGGDILHTVRTSGEKLCGVILWESKRTKTWSDGWLSKLRGDLRTAKADVALIVSHALPKGVETFDIIDGVWVANYRYALPVALAIRQGLLDIAATRQTFDGQKTKTELVYQYLTGPRFKQRVEAIVEKFSEMHSDLLKERKAMTKLWAKREEQIRNVMESTMGMYGDLQGIAGANLAEIEGLGMQLLEVSE